MVVMGRMATILSIAFLVQSAFQRKSLTPTSVDWQGVPGIAQERKEGLSLARAELGYLDALMGALDDEED